MEGDVISLFEKNCIYEKYKSPYTNAVKFTHDKLFVNAGSVVCI